MKQRRRRYRPPYRISRLGFVVPPRPSRKAPPLTPLQLREQAIERAFRAGARYCNNRWKRRCPPRWCRWPVGHPDAAHLLEIMRAFYRGYDAWTRAVIAHNRDWPALPFPQMQAAE